MSMPSRSRTGSGALVAGLLILVAVVAIVAALVASGATPQSVVNSFFPVGGGTPATDQGHATRDLYGIVFAIGAVIFVIVEAAIVFTVFRYRRKPGDEELPPQIHGNNLVEVIWTAIPTAIVLFLFVMSWQTLNKVDATVPESLHVRAVAARYQWQFDYLDASGNTLFTQILPVGADGGLVLPTGEPILISLKSMDVIHAFYVPKFLFKRDVVPGRENSFDFTIDEPGTYRGQCAELCGPSHGQMVFEVHALTPADFTTWYKAQLAKATATPTPAPSGAAPSGAAPSGAAPSGAAPSGAAPSGAPASPAAAGPVLQAEAQGIAFTTTALQAPANTAFTIHFKNADAAIPHNIEIKDPSGATVFKGDIITGPAETDYAVPALPAGSYTFNCTVHTNMTGTLTVQ
jgi:cytochrome c oxidase subunit II